MDAETVLEHYITCALWSSHDNADESGGEPLDSNYGPEDIDAKALETMRADCANFAAYCEKLGLLEEYERDEEQFGHDFWLTRNGHGVGFWDRGDGELGEALSKAAETFGSADLYVGNDGKVHHG